MPDNLHPTPAHFFALPDHAVIALEGPEAAVFAQAQFANDCLQLAVGHWQWNAWLTPKGRVIALFALIRATPERVLLLVRDLDAEQMATQLQRFVFRRKLKVAATPQLRVAGAFRAPAQAAIAQIADDGPALELDFGSAQQPRTLRISAQEDVATDPQALARWFATDLRHGLPRLPDSQREQWTPQQLSLERLPAFSVKKGCYPGQEIVARTHFLGKAKRGLVLFEAAAAVAVDSEVSDGPRALGRVVSACAEPAPLALAVLPLERESGSLAAGDVALRELPLLDGLQR